MAVGIGERPEFFKRKFEKMFFQEEAQRSAREDLGIGGQAQPQGVLLEEALSKGVEGQDVHGRVAVGHQRVDPFFHLPRGLIREGQGQQFFGPRRLRGDQPGDPAGQHGGLARAGSCHDQQRSFAMGDSPELLGIQVGKDGFCFSHGLTIHQVEDIKNPASGAGFFMIREGLDHLPRRLFCARILRRCFLRLWVLIFFLWRFFPDPMRFSPCFHS